MGPLLIPSSRKASSLCISCPQVGLDLSWHLPMTGCELGWRVESKPVAMHLRGSACCRILLRNCAGVQTSILPPDACLQSARRLLWCISPSCFLPSSAHGMQVAPLFQKTPRAVISPFARRRSSSNFSILTWEDISLPQHLLLLYPHSEDIYLPQHLLLLHPLLEDIPLLEDLHDWLECFHPLLGVFNLIDALKQRAVRNGRRRASRPHWTRVTRHRAKTPRWAPPQRNESRQGTVVTSHGESGESCLPVYNEL